MYVQQLSAPFGFLQKDINELQSRAKEQEGKEIHDEMHGDHRYF